VCGTWSTWRAVRRDDTVVNPRSYRIAAARSPCRGKEAPRFLTHI
jgi:hypothetical protein